MTPNAGKDPEHVEPRTWLGEGRLGTRPGRAQQCLLEFNRHLLDGAAVLLLGAYPRETKRPFHTETCTSSTRNHQKLDTTQMSSRE